MSMDIHSFPKPISSFLFILLLQHIKIAISKPPYVPTDIILSNCGSSGQTTTGDGRKWTGDLNSKFGPVDHSNSTKSVSAIALRQGSSVASVPYMTARISQTQFTYTFPVTAGQKFIRLFFYPSNYQGGFNKSKDFFDVKTGPFTLLKNFSASLYSSNGQETFFKEFCLHVGENQQLNLTFSPSFNSYAFINGIEILSMPANLYHTPPEIKGLQFIGEREKFYVGNDTALENIYRLNVGASTVPSTSDTGMYRLWDVDTIFSNDRGLVDDGLGLSLNYSRIPAYIAPVDVYLTDRGMRIGDTNLTWILPVDRGFKYLVRLHFCEFNEDVEINMRRFNVYVDNQTANLGFDVIESSGGVLTPIYNDYIFATGKEKGEVADDYILLITLRPNSSSMSADSFLNGLEVFKSNDSNVAWQLRKRKHHHGAYYKSLSYCLRLKSYKGKSSRTTASSSLPQELCRHFSLEEIKEATNDFDGSLIIGSGGFGNVYRANFDNGATTLAIKRLNRESRQGAREFKTEIEMLSQLRHVNLVSLIGYCIDGGEMILVYDYMINGTLRDHLYENNKKPLEWKQRLEICIGAARGFHYLHAGASHTIIHRDIKTTNILLDENWVAKVSDFGLSKIGVNNSAISTVVKGTWGYFDPEYARRHPLTEKSDVYSFGVVLFEVLCARKVVNRNLDEDEVNLVNWARKCIQNGNIHQIIDPELVGKIYPECFNKFVEIAESCVRDQSIDRPSMHDVMERLQFAMELQQAADSEKEKVNPGGECLYPKVSFHPSRYANIFGGSELDSSNASGLMDLDTDTDTTTGQTFPSMLSASLTSSHGFSDTINSSRN
ncbi:hypothetical protein JCGZ_19969 [Jatropha curcas]|uniref:Protein kinase domain-containing protein n=1 Tax=Jatropha curcas TaxID=180498 RepID=A0A067K4V6_JATCU|nr:hypothetical protein JCGZ_19969 [Jatropha curcas]